MTVTNTPTKNSFNCDGSITEFDFSFPVPADEVTTAIKVVLLNTVTNTYTELTYGTHYTLSAPNNDYRNGGTVTTVSTYASTYKLYVYRELTVEQSSDFVSGGNLPAETVEANEDRAVMMIQEIREVLARALVFSVVDEAANMELPNADERALKNLMFDADGEPIVGSTLSGTVASTWAQTLIDDLTAAAARETMDCFSGDELLCYEGEVLVYEGDVLTYRG